MLAFTMNRHVLRVLIFGMALSFCFFLLDVVLDVQEHVAEGLSYSGGELIHLIFEGGAVIVLFFGIMTMMQYTALLRDQNARAQRKLIALKEDFDEYVMRRFAKWALTPAEKDVALLLLRGLSTADIAELRRSSVGTVKVHAHHVFGKAAVGSRVEFMALFMDEFIDIGVTQQE